MCGVPGIGIEIASVGWGICVAGHVMCEYCADAGSLMCRHSADTTQQPATQSVEPHFVNVPQSTVPSCKMNANCHTVPDTFRWARATTQGDGDGLETCARTRAVSERSPRAEVRQYEQAKTPWTTLCIPVFSLTFSLVRTDMTAPACQKIIDRHARP